MHRPGRILIYCLASMLVSFVALASTGATAAEGDQTNVIVIAYACSTADASLDDCSDLAGVTIQVEADGTEIDPSPVTTSMNILNVNTADFTASAAATLTITQIDGIPDGYVPAAGYDPLVVAVANLDQNSCGGEAVCNYAYIINVPVEVDEPVSELPNTGIGTAIGSSNLNMFTLATLFLILGSWTITRRRWFSAD